MVRGLLSAVYPVSPEIKPSFAPRYFADVVDVQTIFLCSSVISSPNPSIIIFPLTELVPNPAQLPEHPVQYILQPVVQELPQPAEASLLTLILLDEAFTDLQESLHLF